MRNLIVGAAGLLAAVVGGCALHPLPEDITGVPTHVIVRKARCEARQALIDKTLLWLDRSSDPRSRALAAAYRGDRRLISGLKASKLRGEDMKILKKFQDSAIAYNFSLDMTEVNNLDATVDLLKVLDNGKHTGALNGNFDRSRENTRTFTITDTFLNLMTRVKDDYCQNLYSASISAPNYIYPVVGKIGIDEMLDTFIDMSLFDNLSPDAGNKGPPTLTDTLTFTTKLSGSAAPKLELNPVRQIIRVADATVTATGSRTDVHKVTVGLSLPPPATKATPPTPTSVNIINFGNLITFTAKSPSEYSAAVAVEQSIARYELGKPIIVINQ